MGEENLQITLERFEYFIQIILNGYKEIPAITVMFKEGKSVKTILPLDEDLNNFQLISLMGILSFRPKEVFMCIPCNDKKWDAILTMRHKDSDILRQWKHLRGKPLDKEWKGKIK
jgi:hypothetical protein